MKRKLQVGRCIVVATWIVLMLVLLPRFIEAHKENAALEESFSRFSSALVDRDYPTAYAQCSPEFREADSYENFVKQLTGLADRLGQLKAVKRDGYHIVGSGTPMRWKANIDASFAYDKETLRLELVFHKDGGRWSLYGFKEL
jgi:hypothetical protein